MGSRRLDCPDCAGGMSHDTSAPYRSRCPRVKAREQEHRAKQRKRLNELGLCAVRGCGEDRINKNHCERHRLMHQQRGRANLAKARAFDIIVTKLEDVASWWSAQCNGEEAELPEWTTTYPEMEETA